MKVEASNPLAKRHPLAGLVAWIAVTFLAAAAGALASLDARAFYASLSLPPWAPPASVFGPVWSVLYAMMAVAAWLAWRRAPLASAPATWSLFFAQLVANAAWSWLFFSRHLGLAASVDVVILEALIVATLVAFWRLRPLAGALLLPYAAWVAFASLLTLSVWQRNPSLLG